MTFFSFRREVIQADIPVNRPQEVIHSQALVQLDTPGIIHQQVVIQDKVVAMQGIQVANSHPSSTVVMVHRWVLTKNNQTLDDECRYSFDKNHYVLFITMNCMQATPGVSPEIQNMFNAVDSDRSGRISSKELQGALQNGKGEGFSDRCCELMICE